MRGRPRSVNGLGPRRVELEMDGDRALSVRAPGPGFGWTRDEDVSRGGISGRRRSCHRRWALSLAPGCRRRWRPGWLRAVWRAGIALGASSPVVNSPSRPYERARPSRSGAQAIARTAVPSPAGAPRGRQVGGTYPRRLAGCGAGRRQTPRPVPAPRRRTDGCTCRRAHHGAAVSVAMGDWSVITSTSSRESLSNARHMATSSQESQGPCSTPVASSTTV